MCVCVCVYKELSMHPYRHSKPLYLRLFDWLLEFGKKYKSPCATIIQKKKRDQISSADFKFEISHLKTCWWSMASTHQFFGIFCVFISAIVFDTMKFFCRWKMLRDSVTERLQVKSLRVDVLFPPLVTLTYRRQAVRSDSGARHTLSNLNHFNVA